MTCWCRKKIPISIKFRIMSYIRTLQSIGVNSANGRLRCLVNGDLENLISTESLDLYQCSFYKSVGMTFFGEVDDLREHRRERSIES